MDGCQASFILKTDNHTRRWKNSIPVFQVAIRHRITPDVRFQDICRYVFVKSHFTYKTVINLGWNINRLRGIYFLPLSLSQVSCWAAYNSKQYAYFRFSRSILKNAARYNVLNCRWLVSGIISLEDSGVEGSPTHYYFPNNLMNNHSHSSIV